MAVHCHNTPRLPEQTPTRGVLTATVWNELHDFIELAKDALGERPADFDEAFLRNCVMHLRLSIRIAHAALERAETGSPRRMDYLCGSHQPRGGVQ